MRRVTTQHFKNNQVKQGAFLPRKFPNDKDRDGLSVSRQHSAENTQFLTPALFKANTHVEDIRLTSGVLLIPVEFIWELVGNRLRPDPMKESKELGLIADPGHSVVPELNGEEYDNGPRCTLESREKIRNMAAALSDRLRDVKHFAIRPG